MLSRLPPTFVFVHGFMGTDEIKLPFCTLEYFRRIKAMMAARGLPMLVPRLPQAAVVAVRAQALAAALDGAGEGPIVLVGASQGGLDCRLTAARLDPARRIRVVVTLGTPHRGSSLADWALGSRNPVAWAVRRLAPDVLPGLAPEACKRFNQEVPDRDDVAYLSWAGMRPVGEMPLWLRPFGNRLSRAEGDNDGQVAVASARWGEFQGTVRADHYELFGWNFGLPRKAVCRPFLHLTLYQDMVDRVLARLAGC